MEALEILKKFQDEIQTALPNGIVLGEAIEELEGLQNNSCEGCVNYKLDIDEFPYCLRYERDFNFICSRGYWLEDNYNK